MAKMIPPFVAEGTSSKAEIKVFRLLQDDDKARDWIVLHSLALSADGSFRPYGEIDFVLLLPKFGIVCVEVKGGGIRTCDGVWYTTGADAIEKKLKRSPFMQARESMFMLRNRLEAEYRKLHKSIPMQTYYVVVFPDCLCPPVTPEFTRSEVIDADDLRLGIGEALIRSARSKGNKNSLEVVASEDIDFVRKLLRPDFDRVMLVSSILRDAEARIASFTDEQLVRLDDLEDNERCLFNGAAGTGKTALAIYFAKRTAVEGKSTLLLCYNRILGKLIHSQTDSTELLKASSFWSLMNQLVDRSQFRDEFVKRAKNKSELERFNLLAEYGKLAVLEFELKFDSIIIDEAQDLSKEPYLSIINELLIDGLREGRWAMFGDFTQQVIFDEDGAIENIRALCPNFATYKLRRNCRNTKQIASAAVNLADFSPSIYRGKLVEGPKVEIMYYKNSQEQPAIVENIVKKLLIDGITASEIILLSQSKLANSCLSESLHLVGMPLIDISKSDDPLKNGGFLRFSTVAAFKGLESKVVIVTDIERVADEEPEQILYVALTRARVLSFLICNEKIRNKINQKNAKLAWDVN